MKKLKPISTNQEERKKKEELKKKEIDDIIKKKEREEKIKITRKEEILKKQGDEMKKILEEKMKEKLNIKKEIEENKKKEIDYLRMKIKEKEEEEEKRKIEEERKRKEEEERKRKEEEERKRKEEEERRRKEEEDERKRKEEEERKRKEEEERKRKEEEKKRKEEEENKRKEEEERKRIEEERKRKEEERKRKEEEKRKKKEEEERKRKEYEEEKRKEEEMKKKILENQKKLREKNKNLNQIKEQNKNKQINAVLEDMCIYGYITKKEIKEEKKKNPEKFIETSQALKLENKDDGIFALGLISKNLENLGIETAIEVKENTDTQEEDLTSLQFLCNGMINKKKFDLHFELGEKRNNELLNNEKEYEKFKEKLKNKLSKEYNIPKEKIIIILPQKGSFHVQLIFQSDEFQNLNKQEFINKFKNDKEFSELSNLKDIHEEILTGAVKLTRNQLDPRGNRVDGWGIGEKRGGKDYDPPLGWKGIGLRVMDKYDNGDNTWIGMNNSPGEWCVAYHGVGRNQCSDNVKNATGNIIKTTFKPGSDKGQFHKDCEDVFHPGQKVGRGVYCTPFIKTAGNSYSGISEINGIKYKTVLMVRVKQEAIRHCKCEDYWVVNGTTDEIRPYRILYKKYD